MWQYLVAGTIMLVALGILWNHLTWQSRDAARVRVFIEREDPQLKADPRFAQVKLFWYTGGAVGVSGSVASQADAGELRKILEQDNDTGLPLEWVLWVPPAGKPATTANQETAPAVPGESAP